MSKIQELQEQLNNSEAKVRMEAIKQAYEVGSHEAYGLLMYAAHHHFSPETRRAAHKGALLLQKKLFEKAAAQQKATEIEAGIDDEVKQGLNSPEAQVRIDTIRAIASKNQKELYPVVLKQLHSEQNVQVQSILILACARLGDQECQPHLRQFLRSGDQDVRACVVKALASFRNDENVPLFLLFGRDPAANVRAESIKALEACNHDQIKKAIASLQERNRDVEKDAIIYAIARFQIKDCYSILQELSKDPSQTIQERASKALDYVSKSQETVVESPPEPPKEVVAQKPKVEIQTPSAEPVPTPDKLEEEVGSSSAETDEQEENFLRVIRQGEESSALQGLFDLIALNRLTRLAELIEPINDRNSKRVTATFLMAIGQSKDRGLKDYVLESLENKDGRIQANAVEAVRMLDLTEELKSQILPLATQSSNDRVRANSIISLHKSGLIDTKAELESMLKSSKDNRKLSALYAIQDLMDPSMIPLLENPIDSPNPKVTKKALEILKNFYLEEEKAAIALVAKFGIEEEMKVKVEELSADSDDASDAEPQEENMENLLESMSGEKTEGDAAATGGEEPIPDTSKVEKKDGLSKIKNAFQNLFKKK